MFLTEEQQMLRDTVRDFAENEVKPIAAEIDETCRFPWETVKQMGGGITVSVPSLRPAGSDSEMLVRFGQTTSHTSLTFAPEAGSQRLRDVINKQITEDEILDTIGSSFKQGRHVIKLYFMLGLPTETKTDIKMI